MKTAHDSIAELWVYLCLYKCNIILNTIVFINQMVYNIISVSLEVLYDYG